jgi:hypothetical protein
MQAPQISQEFGYIPLPALEESRAIGLEFLRPISLFRQHAVVWIEFSPSPPRLFRLLHTRILPLVGAENQRCFADPMASTSRHGDTRR